MIHNYEMQLQFPTGNLVDAVGSCLVVLTSLDQKIIVDMTAGSEKGIQHSPADGFGWCIVVLADTLVFVTLSIHCT